MSETATLSRTERPAAFSSGPSMSGKDMGLYAIMIVVWGTSWIAMAHQVAIVPAIVTGVYRFALAAAVTFLWAFIGKYPLRFPLRVHLRLALVGVFMFSSNFVMFYYAASLIASGLMAVIFSLASLFNMILSALFLGARPSRQGLVGTVLGLCGIALIFWPEIRASAGNDGVLLGLGFGLCGTLLFCTGNILSVANRTFDIPLISANSWCMTYGTLWLVFLALVLDVPFLMDWSGEYWIAMGWLVVMASVVAFWGYMTLLNSIGPARAGYLTVLFPVVALILSTLFENYHWTVWGLAGLASIITGNILVMRGGGRKSA
nr:DMT family transporter [uncultured Cohaesibacter sp.]